MFFPWCDFHTHTTRSDGRLTPIELVRKAYAAGIRVLSITDHNSTEDLSYLRRFIAEEFEEEMTLVQGAEVSAIYVDGKGTAHELHVVALGFNPDDQNMKALLAAHQSDRRPYMNAMLKRLKEECGIDLGSYESIRAQFPNRTYMGRMTLARLMADRGITASVDEAFDRYLGSHGERRAYVKNPFRYSSLETVLRTIIQAGGIPILAHLLYYDLDDGCRTGGVEKERLVRTFKEMVNTCGGIGGMEVYYTRYKDMHERLYLLRMAQKYGLLISGGSDYHEQETWETLAHHLSCSACSDLTEQLGVEVHYSLMPAKLYVMSGSSGIEEDPIAERMKACQIDGKPVALIQSHFNRPPCWEAVTEALENKQAVLLEMDWVGLMRLLTDGKINPKLVQSVYIAADAAAAETHLRQREAESRQMIRSKLEMEKEERFHLELYDAVIESHVGNDPVRAVIAAFEGKPPANSFDPAKFRADTEQILAAY